MTGIEQMCLALTRWDGKAPRARGVTETLLAVLRHRGAGVEVPASELAALADCRVRDVRSHLAWAIGKGQVKRGGTKQRATYALVGAVQ